MNGDTSRAARDRQNDRAEKAEAERDATLARLAAVRTEAATFLDVIVSYMLGEVDGDAVAAAEVPLRAALRGGPAMTAWPAKPTPEPTCGCPYRWGDYGRLHGVGMGHGWIRTGTSPDCTEGHR